MAHLSTNRQILVVAPTLFGSILVTVTLFLAPPGNAQVLMNLAPRALPNSPVGPSFSGTLDAVKQRLNTPVSGPTQSQPPQAGAGMNSHHLAVLDVIHLRHLQFTDLGRSHSGTGFRGLSASGIRRYCLRGLGPGRSSYRGVETLLDGIEATAESGAHGAVRKGLGREIHQHLGVTWGRRGKGDHQQKRTKPGWRSHQNLMIGG